MKRILQLLFATAMMLAVSLNVDAQFKKKENNRVTDRFHMGIRGGYSQSLGDVDDIMFVHGGIGIDFQIAPVPLFLETGAYYMNKGQIDWDGTDEDHYAYAPLLLSYHVNIGPNLFLQPFFGGIAGYLGTTEEFDAGIRTGIGFNFGRLYANIGYDFGLVEQKRRYTIRNDGHPDKWKNNTLFVTVGFNWSGRR